MLDRLQSDPATANIPVIICTSSVLGDAERARLGQARSILSKATLTREVMQRLLAAVWQDTMVMPVAAVSAGAMPAGRVAE